MNPEPSRHLATSSRDCNHGAGKLLGAKFVEVDLCIIAVNREIMTIARTKEGVPRESNVTRALRNRHFAGRMGEFKTRNHNVSGGCRCFESVRTGDLDTADG